MTDPTSPVDLSPQEQEAYEAFLTARAAQTPDNLAADTTPAPSPTQAAGDVDDEEYVAPLYPDRMNGRPRFLVIESNLHVQTTKHGELVLPLDIPTNVFRKIGGDQEELDQLFAILDALGEAGTAEKLGDLGILETMGIVVRFFSEFEKKAKATMGESGRSSK